MIETIVAPTPATEQRYVERLPHPALRDVISCVFVQEVSVGGATYIHRSVPNGSAEVCVQLGSSGPVVTGPQRHPSVSTLEPGAVVVGVRFHPGAASTVLGVPASELTDRSVELELVWGGEAGVLAGRLDDATSPGEAAGLLEGAFLRRMTSAPEPDPIVGELVGRLQPWRARRVSDQASELFLSARQLRRRCLEAVGFGPKVIHRILRFQAFLALADGAGKPGIWPAPRSPPGTPTRRISPASASG